MADWIAVPDDRDVVALAASAGRVHTGGVFCAVAALSSAQRERAVRSGSGALAFPGRSGASGASENGSTDGLRTNRDHFGVRLGPVESNHDDEKVGKQQ